MTRKDAKKLALDLYVRGDFTQGEISERVGFSQQTISNWKKTEGWEELRTAQQMTKRKQLKRAYDQLNDINSKIETRDERSRHPDSKEIITIRELTNTIAKLEKRVNTHVAVDVMIAFNEFVQRNDLELSKKLAELQNAFIKSL